jgi:hypothetical protein
VLSSEREMSEKHEQTKAKSALSDDAKTSFSTSETKKFVRMRKQLEICGMNLMMAQSQRVQRGAFGSSSTQPPKAQRDMMDDRILDRGHSRVHTKGGCHKNC